ncbi:MAG: TonB family protein [Blastocatellia bacterium]
MFSELVESTKQKQQGRSRFYLVTSLIYGTSLSALAVATIVWFNPALAEANTNAMMIAPPTVPIVAKPPEAAPVTKVQPDPGFVEPKTPPPDIMDASKVPPKPPITHKGPVIVDPLASGNGAVAVDLISRNGTSFSDEAGAPPPPPAPKPKMEPTPTPTPKPPDVMKVSSVLLQGKAVQKVQPPYPQIAKTARIQGTVQVAILISQEGRVISAEAVSGHPMLREAAVQAARQWVFSPTSLNGSSVKVSGVIAFNFTLN